MKKILFLLIVISAIQNGLCQSKNSINISTGGLYFPKYNLFNYGIFIHYGISYEHKIKPKIGVGLSFSQWSTTKEWAWGGNFSLSPRIDRLVVNLEKPFKWELYKFYNIFVDYNVVNKKRYSFSVVPEFCVAKGVDTYVKSAVYSDDLGGSGWVDLVSFEFIYKKNTYLGAGLGAEYDLKLFNQRLLVGINSKINYYPKAFLQVSYGIHTGFNF